MSYSLGLLRPDPAKSAHRLHASLHASIDASATPKGAASLTPCERIDQGGTGCCHACSGVAVTWTACNAAGKALAFVPSPRLLASCTYADVRAAANPAGQPFPPLQDTGADLSDDARALATWGIAPIQAPTSDGRFCDIENDPPNNVFPEPDTSQLQIAGSNLIAGEYQIPVDANAPKLCALALDAGIPIWLGFLCDSAFQALGASDIAQAPNQSDPSAGGHAVYISAYRTNASGQFEWLVQNSWGSGWADNGAVWASTAWLEACWMLWPMAVSS